MRNRSLFTVMIMALAVFIGLLSPAAGASATTTTALPAWPNVTRGANGPTVQTAQYLLRHRGYDIAADGDFGGNTYTAVRQFQAANGLSVDGEIGPRTWPKLIATVRRGNINDAVRGAQTQLNRYGHRLVVDGNFGGNTYTATTSYQSGHGLDPDGVIGPMTWQSLIGGSPGSPSGYSLPVARGALPRTEYDDPHHDYPAIDLPVRYIPAYAMVSGTVYRIFDGENTGCGYGVKILKDGVYYQYCHFKANSWTVSNGQKVTAGQKLGTTGTTGNSTGPHLHIAIKIDGTDKRCPQNFLLAVYDGRTPPNPRDLPRTGCFY